MAKPNLSHQQIRKAAVSFRRGLLGKNASASMCFAVCAPLQAWLSVCGCETELIEADFGYINHFWLRFDDGTILDPTADQFGLEPVYLGPMPPQYEVLMQNKAH